MQDKIDTIKAKKAKLDKIRKDLRKRTEELRLEYEKLQLDCPHTETTYDSGWGRMPDVTCDICGKIL